MSLLPSSSAFWMPRGDEIGEEGFGFFRDTWLIRGVTATEARDLMAIESAIAEVVDDLADDEDDFERLAIVAESGSLNDPAHELTPQEHAALSNVVSDIPELESLELGVAGLAHALACVRILPAASCRSHPSRSWSDAPVVLCAITEYRARALQPLVEASGCTFAIDGARPELLVVRGRSIENTMTLAEMVVENREEFVRHRRIRRPRRQPSSIQDALF